MFITKKSTCIFLICFLLLLGFTPALAQEGNLLPGLWVQSTAAREGAVYALSRDDAGQRILEIIPEQEPTTFLPLKEEEALTHLLVEGDKLYGLNQASGRIALINKDQLSWQEQTLDTSILNAEKYMAYAPFLFEGNLFTPLVDFASAEAFIPLALAKNELDSGKGSMIPLPDAVSIVPYKEGQLLLLQVEQQGESYYWKLASFDLKSEKTTLLPMKMPEAFEHSSGIGALTYDRERDRILFADKSQVMASTALAPFERVGLASFDHISFDYGQGMMVDSLYAVNNSGLFFIKVDEVLSMPTLTIRGHAPSSAVSTFRQEHPDALPILQEQSIKSEDVYIKAQGGDDTVDIYILPLNAGLRALMDKDFALDLSAKDALRKDAAGLYPVLTAAITDKQGRIKAIPVDLNSMSTTFKTDHWQEIFPGRAFPTTWGELMSLRMEFAKGERDDLIFFALGDSPQVIKHLVSDYILYYEQEGVPLDFNHPALKEALTSYLSAKEERLDVEVEDFSIEVGPTNHLVSLFGSAAQFYVPDELDTNQIIPPLVYEAGQAPRQKVSLQVAIINPLSKNPDLAMDFLEILSRKETDPRRYYAIHPDENEPFPYPEQELTERIQFMEQQAKSFEESIKRMESGEEEERDLPFLRNRLIQIKADLKDQERVKWMLSTEQIAAYRAQVTHMSLTDRSLLMGEQAWAQAQGLIEQLYQGALGLDAFIAEMNQLSKLVYQENK